MNILVTGGAGFIGSHIVDAYIREGHTVIVIDKSSSNIEKHKNQNAIYYCFDITKDLSQLDAIFKKHSFDIVNNHAAQVSAKSSVEDPVNDLQQNVQVTLNLLEMSKKHHVKKFIFSSSAAVYGDIQQLPLNENVDLTAKQISPYGLSKKTAEDYVKLYAKQHDLSYIIFRYANVYGPRQMCSDESGVISIFINNLLKDINLTIFGDGEQTRDFIYVKDLVNANLSVLKEEIKNQIINVSTNSQISINKLAQTISHITNSKSNISHVENREGDIKHSKLDNTLAQSLFALNPTSLEDGLKETIAWFKSNQPKKKTVTIIGLGYVGLPLACLVSRQGYTTYGLDINEEIVSKTNQFESHIKDEYLEQELAKLKQQNKKIIATTDAACIAQSDVVVVCVPTPIAQGSKPNLNYIKSASESIAQHIKKGQVISIESTIFPGTCEEIIQPILESSGLKAGSDFYLAHCPERIDPGNKKWTIETLPRVFSALSDEGKSTTKQFYESIITSSITQLSDLRAAEATKVVENTFRDINIAFVNELAQSFDTLGIDVTEVIKGAATKPFAFMPHYPGCGVGGHCIPVDPYYLIAKAKEKGFTHSFMELARSINNNMPLYTIKRIEESLAQLGQTFENTKISVLGIAYKGNVDDARESPALKIIEELKNKNTKLTVYDPHLPQQSTASSLQEALNADIIVVCTDHNEFKEINPHNFQEAGVKVIIDGRNCLNKEEIASYGIIYKGIGR